MKTIALFLLLPVLASAQSTQLQAFPLTDVRLHAGVFEEARQTDLQYMLALDPDRLLAPYRREAGLQPKAPRYGNWEGSGLDGHIGGHYLSALALMYASTGDAQLLKRLQYMVNELDSCQRKHGDGYVGGVPGGRAMWQQVAQGNIAAENFSLNKKWVPWYNLHKLYAGLLDAYRVAGVINARKILIGLCDWCIRLTENLSDEQMQQMLRSEHGGMNEVFAAVADMTGEQKYLRMAMRFSDRRILNPLLQQKDLLNGLHANTQIPKVIGYLYTGLAAHDTAWAQAAAYFWKTVVDNRTVSIGGNSVREHFHPANDFSSMLESKEGPETCNSYNMLKLSKALFLLSGDVRYLDYYERTLYNHILSSQHPDGGFVYFTPMRPRHYRVYSQPGQGFWCCVGSGLENHAKYGELIYAHNQRDVYINLFIPSSLQWKEKGLEMTQTTAFPQEEQSTVQLKLKKSQRFTVYVRLPKWIKNGLMHIAINDKPVKTMGTKNGYVAIDRLWRSGDRITMQLPMGTTVESLPDGSDWISFVHGPLVLAAATDTTGLQGLRADDSRMGHIANGPLYPLEQAPVIISDGQTMANAIRPVTGKPLTFQLTAAVYPETYNKLTLVPFYRVHDARYMLYWPISNREHLEKRNAAIRAREAERLALEERTIDHVIPGQQQPESDHGFRGEKTEAGVFRDRHWRHAQGWFSYEIKNKTRDARSLRLTYNGSDRNRHFDILVNDTKIATVHFDGRAGDRFVDVDYLLPEALRQAQPDVLVVKFAAHSGSIAGGIFDVRLLR